MSSFTRTVQKRILKAKGLSRQPKQALAIVNGEPRWVPNTHRLIVDQNGNPTNGTSTRWPTLLRPIEA